jgi:molecular chaperone HscC
MATIGIDLGTTNSAASVWINEEQIQIPNRVDKHITPSVVGIDEKNNIIVGATAKERLLTHPNETVAVFKRLMGANHKVTIGKKSFTAPELSALVLRSLKEDAETFLNEEVTEAVISVPAYFNENQRAATKLAGELAGLKVRRLINEPTAAAMSYGLNKRQSGTFMILDLGGGTFDVSILEYFNGIMEVHASAGDNHLGGEDFVELMVDRILQEHTIEKKDLSVHDQHQIYMQMETIKKRIDLIDEETINITVGEKKIQWVVTQTWFNQIITPLLLRIKQPIQQALQDAQIHANEIDDVILVGGSTRLKAFRALVAKLFGRLPSCNLDPDTVVSIGVGIQAGLVDKNQALDDIVLTDVCPYTLGTEVHDSTQNSRGQFFPIIERNSVVPISIEKPLCTLRDNQTEMSIDVYQGEHRLVEHNVFLGDLKIKIPKNKAGKEVVNVRYSYDMNGLLEVDITVQSTGKTYNKVIENAPGLLSEKELSTARQKLAKLKFHPREDEVNRNLIARAERIYSSSIGKKREQIGQYISRFEVVLNNQKQQEIAKAQVQFEEVLSEFDSEDWI